MCLLKIKLSPFFAWSTSVKKLQPWQKLQVLFVEQLILYLAAEVSTSLYKSLFFLLPRSVHPYWSWCTYDAGWFLGMLWCTAGISVYAWPGKCSE